MSSSPRPASLCWSLELSGLSTSGVQNTMKQEEKTFCSFIQLSANECLFFNQNENETKTVSSPHHVTILRPALDPPLPRQWCPALRPPPLCYLSSASHSPACRQVTVGLSPRRQLEPLWPLLVLERRARTTRRSGLNRCPTIFFTHEISMVCFWADRQI